MGFSTELPCDKAFGFPERATYEQMREAPKMKDTSFFNLLLEMTAYYFCPFLDVDHRSSEY